MKLYSITDELVPHVVGEFPTLEAASAGVTRVFADTGLDPSTINFFVVDNNEVKWWDENDAGVVWRDCETQP
jgi:hypothetical protein